MTTTAGPPNILLVMADQLSAFATGPYGNRDVLTPHLDALATRGTTFAHAYCNSPLCVPARAALMTGQLPSRLPVNDNGEGFDANVPTFAHHLRRGGYHTALAGKMHFVGPDQLHGLETRLTTDIYQSDYLWTPSWARLREMVCRARDPGDETNYPAHLSGQAGAVRQAGPVPWATHFAHDEEVHYRTLEYLRTRGTSEDNCPWFLCASYTHPHDPYTTTPEYWERYAGRELTPPDEPPPGHAPHVMDEWVNVHHGINRLGLRREDALRARRGYYGNTSYIDDKLGDLVAELARLGLAEHTVVIFTSDHGDQCGERGMWLKRTLHEWSARVPLVAAGPGIAAGNRVAANATLVDLFPTLLSLAGLRLPAGYADYAPTLDGRDLAPWLRGEVPSDWDDTVTIEYNGDGTCAPIRALVQGPHKFIGVGGEADQLYDLARDPGEWHNLAADPAHADTARTLRARLYRDWDPATMEAAALASQRRRLFLNEALYQGQYTAWDYQPVFDATRMYSRRSFDRPWAEQVYQRWLIDSQGQSAVRDASADADRDGR